MDSKILNPENSLLLKAEKFGPLGGPGDFLGSRSIKRVFVPNSGYLDPKADFRRCQGGLMAFL